MKRLLLLFPLLLFSCGFGWGTQLPLVERVLKSVVPVIYPIENGQFHVCTGFVVNTAKGEVLSARHCVAEGLDVTVDGKPSRVLRMGDTLILLYTTPMTRPPLEIRTKPMVLAERVLAFGYGYGMMEVLGRGVAMQHGGDIGVDGPFIPGMSGGPVVDLNGKVVGIVQASNEVMGVACGQQEIADFLHSK